MTNKCKILNCMDEYLLSNPLFCGGFYYIFLVKSVDFSYIFNIKCQMVIVIFFLKFVCLYEVLNMSSFLAIS